MTMTTCNTPARTFAKQRPSAVKMIAHMFAAQNQRRALRNLDSAALNDLGLSYEDAKAEANRPFWDVPANWRR